MINRILSIALLGAVIIGNTSCNSGGDFQKLHGIEYKIVKHGSGQKAKIGDIVEMNIIATADTQELGNSRKDQMGKPVPMRVDTPGFRGDYKAVFPLLSVGDSAVVRVSMDTIMKAFPDNKQRMPPWMKKGKFLTFKLSIVSVKSMDAYRKDMEAKQAQMQQEMKEKAAAQAPIDDKLLQEYFAKNNIKAEKTASGLYYTVQKAGSGAQIARGQKVSMMYTGKTLEGKAFDSNIDSSIGHHGNEPLVFTVGMGQMIPGVDEGAALLKKGAKATLYLLSPLAYGPQSPSPNIAPNAVLIFDVEITDVKAATDAPHMPAQQQIR